MIAERLKILRKERGYTQQHVASGLNIGYTHYQKYEYGEKIPGRDKLIELADYFDVSIDYLLGRTDDPRLHRLGDDA